MPLNTSELFSGAEGRTYYVHNGENGLYQFEIEGVNDDVVVATIGDDIVVKNAPLGSSVRVYAADGSIISSEVPTDGDVVVEAPIKGVYIVSVNGKTFKVMVK